SVVYLGLVPASGGGALGRSSRCRWQRFVVDLDVSHAGTKLDRYRCDTSGCIFCELRPVLLGEESDVYGGSFAGNHSGTGIGQLVGASGRQSHLYAPGTANP